MFYTSRALCFATAPPPRDCVAGVRALAQDSVSPKTPRRRSHRAFGLRGVCMRLCSVGARSGWVRGVGVYARGWFTRPVRQEIGNPRVLRVGFWCVAYAKSPPLFKGWVASARERRLLCPIAAVHTPCRFVRWHKTVRGRRHPGDAVAGRWGKRRRHVAVCGCCTRARASS